MAVDLYSTIRVGPSQAAGIEVAADIPLEMVTSADKTGLPAGNHELLEPLRLAAKATLNHLRSKAGNLRVEASCEIPIGAGLGSSASTTVATISAVAKSRRDKLDRREIFELAFIPERYLHGKPSGVDQATSTYGGVIQYKRPSQIVPIDIKRPPTLVVCDSGFHRSTKKLVGSVVKKSQKQKSKFETHLNEVSSISSSVVKALRAEESHDLGSLMNRNHELLKDIGVSTPRLDLLVSKARKAGALGAKLTGAGGGGCIIALCEQNKDRLRIGKMLRKAGGKVYNVSLDARGVQ